MGEILKPFEFYSMAEKIKLKLDNVEDVKDIGAYKILITFYTNRVMEAYV